MRWRLIKGGHNEQGAGGGRKKLAGKKREQRDSPAAGGTQGLCVCTVHVCVTERESVQRVQSVYCCTEADSLLVQGVRGRPDTWIHLQRQSSHVTSQLTRRSGQFKIALHRLRRSVISPPPCVQKHQACECCTEL